MCIRDRIYPGLYCGRINSDNRKKSNRIKAGGMAEDRGCREFCRPQYLYVRDRKKALCRAVLLMERCDEKEAG